MSFSNVNAPASLKSAHIDGYGGHSSAQTSDNSTDLPLDVCIHRLFERQVQKTPQAIAVITENTKFTYQQLNRQANRLAYQLSALGVGPNHLVGICVERSLDMVVGLLAILKAGGAYVPIDPDYPTERIEFILRDTQVKVLLSQTHLEPTLTNCLSGQQTTLICLDRDRWTNMRSCPDPKKTVGTDNLMYVMYTSGSTGRPKGVMIPHHGICNQLHWRQTTFALNAEDRVLQNISFSFDPSVWQIFWPLVVGAQLVLPNSKGHQDVTYLVQLITEQAISVIALVPSLLRVLLEHPALEQCQTLRHIFCGGEVLPLDLRQQFFQRFMGISARLHNVYGPTETSIDATYWTCEQTNNSPIAPIGYPITNTQIHILDNDQQPTEVGQIGEIYIGGAGLAQGYLNRPDLTTARFSLSSVDQSRIYRTGDLGKYLPNGMVQFLGRVDQQVKIRGFRIELGEIESCLDQHPAIAQSAVTAWEFAPGQKRLLAYFVSRDTMSVDVTRLRNWLQERLPDYMIPAIFMPLASFPLNTNGKLDRKALPTPISQHTYVANEGASLQDEWQLQLAKLWCQVLGVSTVAQTDNFFELGGDSLLATQLATRIEKTFKHPFSVANLFQASTLSQMATLIQKNQGDTPDLVLIPIQTEGSKPPLFCLHTKTGSIFDYYGLAKYLAPDQPVYGLQARGLDNQEVFYQLKSQRLQYSIETLAADYIREIQMLQPAGPYYLCGYSFGGLLAYEIAQQLTAQGQSIGMVALFDTYNNSDSWFHRPLSLRLRNVVGRFQTLSWSERSAYSQQKLRSLGAVFHPSSAIEQQAQEKITVHEAACEAALKHYQVKTYSGDIVLFKAGCTPEEFGYQATKVDDYLGWDQVVTGQIKLQPVECHHFLLMDEPYVQSLAQKLSICLNEHQHHR